MKTYNFNALPQELLAGTRELLPALELTEAADGLPVTAKKADGPSITRSALGICIGYNKKPEFFRMLAMIESTLIGDEYSETPRHTMLCHMADQSRNAVFTPEAARRMVRTLACVGFDSMQLYTEDTYEIEGEPYFGYMRGRWTKAQLKELVAYADLFGMEIIPCIQTLAHLERTLIWPCYKELIDYGNILLVGDPKVYALIDKMFATAAECFTSRRINIGMDEAHMLGLGKYLDKHGFRNRSQIMTEHLAEVCKIAEKYGFHPMMWSDMFFRLAFEGQYYVAEGSIPQEVIDAVPENLTLIYWDYYTSDVKTVSNMVRCHKQFTKNDTAFAGGFQRWGRFTSLNEFDFEVESMHIEECLKYGITNIMGTGWGDNGSEASQFAILPSFLLYAEKCYKGEFDRAWLDARLEEVYKVPMAPFSMMHQMEYLPGFNKLDSGANRYSKYILYTDILTGIHYKHIDRDFNVKYYKDLSEKFAAYTSNKQWGYIFRTMVELADVCSRKSALACDIRDCYNAGDKEKLLEIANVEIPAAIEAVSKLLAAVEKQWRYENRTFGLEVQHIRMGGLKERMNAVAGILKEYCAGVIDHIDELEETPLYADCRPEDSDLPKALYSNASWAAISSVNIL